LRVIAPARMAETL